MDMNRCSASLAVMRSKFYVDDFVEDLQTIFLRNIPVDNIAIRIPSGEPLGFVVKQGLSEKCSQFQKNS